MIISINQPAYLPWLGYFDRIAHSDVHVILDHVQFEKNSYINRNKIRTKDGWQWLTIPVSGEFGTPINQLKIDNKQKWPVKHWKAIKANYSKVPYFTEYGPFFEQLYEIAASLSFTTICSLITKYCMDALNIRTRLVCSSDFNPRGAKSELVLNICREFKADTYLSGPLGRNYLDEDSFRRAGIELAYHDYQHPEYSQLYRGFEPYMAVVDLLMCAGPDSKDILMGESDVSHNTSTGE